MLKNKGAGWASLIYKDDHFPVSYISEAPIDILDACLWYLKYGCGTVTFDGEDGPGTELIIQDDPFIIVRENNVVIVNIDMSPMEIVDEIIRDIEDETVEKWAKSFAIYSENDAELWLQDFRSRLQGKLDEVKKYRNWKGKKTCWKDWKK